MAQKRPHSPDLPSTPSQEQYFRSAPIDDRQSTFVAIFSPTATGRDLQKHSGFKKADHKMVATRKASNQQTIGGAGKRIFNTWSDDDGEKYAGKHLERVLNEMDVEGAVVVARWYGGVLLGPVRFEHIKSCARDAVRKWKAEKSQEDDVQAKKVKVDEGEAKERLVKELQRRDESIVVLRRLLGQKMSKGKDDEVKGNREGEKVPSPAKKMEYDEMPLARLKQLDKARDATITFILKQIDAAEQKEKAETNGETKRT